MFVFSQEIKKAVSTVLNKMLVTLHGFYECIYKCIIKELYLIKWRGWIKTYSDSRKYLNTRRNFVRTYRMCYTKP